MRPTKTTPRRKRTRKQQPKAHATTTLRWKIWCYDVLWCSTPKCKPQHIHLRRKVLLPWSKKKSQYLHQLTVTCITCTTFCINPQPFQVASTPANIPLKKLIFPLYPLPPSTSRPACRPECQALARVCKARVCVCVW